MGRLRSEPSEATVVSMATRVFLMILRSSLPGAVRVEADRVRDHLHEIPRGRGLVPYCAGPNEEASVRVAEELMRQGFADVHALVGGFEAWKRAGRTLEHKPA